MLFGRKKKKMIDVAELVRRGKVIPAADVRSLKSNSEGFVEIGSGNRVKRSEMSGDSGGDFVTGKLGNGVTFFDDVSSTGESATSDISDGQLLQLQDQLQRMDSLLYKIEQRIDVLERKAGVGPGNSGGEGALGAMGW